MNSPRRRAREVAMKALYQAEMAKSEHDDALNQVLSETVYYPVFEAVARDFLKSSKSQIILSGEVEAFVPDFSDSLSTFPHETAAEIPQQIKAILEKYFKGYTYEEASQGELEHLFKKVAEKRAKLQAVEEFSRQLIGCANEHIAEVDKVLAKTAENWSLERMAALDRCILRVAACELFHFADIPANASINEAIELAKKYSADRSYEFINGILDKICKENNLNKSVTSKPVTPGKRKKMEDVNQGAQNT